MQAIEYLTGPEQVAAIANPIRAQILDASHSPTTSAALARSFGRSRQSMGYHVKVLERLGLLRRVGERRNGNFVEQLFQATARRFAVAAEFSADASGLRRAFGEQASLAALLRLGEGLQRDAVELLDSVSGDVEVPSVSLEAGVRLKDEASREAFMAEIAEVLKGVLMKYAAPSDDRNGKTYRVAFATYPGTEEIDD